MILREALKKGERYLDAQQIGEAALDAWYLLEHLLKKTRTENVNRAWYFLHWEEEMSPQEELEYRDLLEKRGRHIPLQHLTGVQEFMGLEFFVNDQVLIPRQDTETLVEEAAKVLKPGAKVLDLCTGSGCVILSLAALVEGIEACATDLSRQALKVAERNAKRLGKQVVFRQGDLWEPVVGRYDVIVSNPPYIPTGEIAELMEEVRCHDPWMALDGREDGLYFYRKLTERAASFLRPGGWLLAEIGCSQGQAVSELFRRAGLLEVSVVKDLAGLDRVVKGKCCENEEE